jgi:copper oxidase (laccase) domain-containing protein
MIEFQVSRYWDIVDTESATLRQPHAHTVRAVHVGYRDAVADVVGTMFKERFGLLKAGWMAQCLPITLMSSND